MRRLWILLIAAFASLSLILAACAKKEIIREAPEEGEEQPEGTGPKPPPIPGVR